MSSQMMRREFLQKSNSRCRSRLAKAFDSSLKAASLSAVLENLGFNRLGVAASSFSRLSCVADHVILSTHVCPRIVRSLFTITQNKYAGVSGEFGSCTRLRGFRDHVIPLRSTLPMRKAV